MSDEVVRAAKAAAATEGVTVARLVEKAVRAYLHGARDVRLALITDDIEWFEANRGRLARKHEGEYLAVVDKRVVDHDSSFDALARRVRARYGTRPLFMPLCERSPRVERLRSPRVAT